MNQFRKDFPVFAQNELIYLDSAATSQKPVQVLEAEADYYRYKNANPHRGAYDLSILATGVLDQVRTQVKAFLHAPSYGEVVFTKNATEALNLVAMSYGMEFVKSGDEILISVMEHHSNLVPWQIVAKRTGATLRYLYPDRNGVLSMEEVSKKITDRTRILAITHVSNVTGIVNPIGQIADEIHKQGGILVVDGTQAVPHMKIDVSECNADFYVFSGHKMLAPMGIGVLYGKKSLLEAMPPFLYGGDMIEYVEEQDTTFAPVPEKFEAGTHNLGSIAGLGAAIAYLEEIGMDRIEAMEQELGIYLLDRLGSVSHVNVPGIEVRTNRIGVVPFVVEGVHPHDVATILNKDHIAVRSGNHCAQPYHAFLDIPATCRASVYLYNSKEEIDALAESLKQVRRWLGYGT